MKQFVIRKIRNMSIYQNKEKKILPQSNKKIFMTGMKTYSQMKTREAHRKISKTTTKKKEETCNFCKMPFSSITLSNCFFLISYLNFYLCFVFLSSVFAAKKTLILLILLFLEMCNSQFLVKSMIQIPFFFALV